MARSNVAIICKDHNDGEAWLAENGLLAGKPLFVTPRSPSAARGRVLTAVFITDSMKEHRRRDELLEATAPALLTG
ncbi:hypothetical protein [Arthrobacter sp. Soil762]|uniref:hypothetical protein n=1 Tax=Arthrobacter sp. Soil762 TaxID=1736401 RepID=UPI000700F1F7|nr:hypothetical protein [Arthrobacter sp. Soil762]KRE72597.1 hypothetical protein ASG77_07965 [Arthrobacter sp. Soil762]